MNLKKSVIFRISVVMALLWLGFVAAYGPDDNVPLTTGLIGALILTGIGIALTWIFSAKS
jgi:hypothetical protein